MRRALTFLQDSMISQKQYVDAALSILGVDRLVLAIHDQSFPATTKEELGRGSPYCEGGRHFAEFISGLGFNAFQLGPQGLTSVSNPSPYDSTLFSKNALSISLTALARDPQWAGLLRLEDIAGLVEDAPSKSAPRDRKSYEYAWHAQNELLKKAHQNFVARSEELKHLWLAYMVWTRQHAHWLERDSLFEALAFEHGTDDWRQWPGVDQSLLCEGGKACSPEQDKRISQIRIKHQTIVDLFQFCQFVVHLQHQSFRELTATLQLKLYADMQIGFSQRDMWALRYLLLPNYLLGAPPSRTNPNGQPWGYPVLDPDLYFARDQNGMRVEGAAILWLITRIEKLLLDFEGIRIDHPHGFICPWIYRSDEPDALRAVQQGARLFESPEVAGHEELAKYALVRPEQLNQHLPRYADGWVRELSEEQVAKYGILIQIIRDRMDIHGFDPSDVVCEVLSSCPFPLKSVLKRHGLGRFRVTQKAQPHNEKDVYRSDNAQPEDWIMVGTHDTRPIWTVVDEWSAGQSEAWAEYLANRLEPRSESKRTQLQLELSTSKPRLVEAMFADLFIGPARNVSIFFADLLGIRQTYNQPGVIGDTNWVLSVPNDYEQTYSEKVKTGQALNLPKVLAMAVNAKTDSPEAKALIERLTEFAAVPIA